MVYSVTISYLQQMQQMSSDSLIQYSRQQGKLSLFLATATKAAIPAKHFLGEK